MIDTNPALPHGLATVYGTRESTAVARRILDEHAAATRPATELLLEDDGVGQTRYGHYQTLTAEDRAEIDRKRQEALAAAEPRIPQDDNPRHRYRGMNIPEPQSSSADFPEHDGVGQAHYGATHRQVVS